MQPFITLGTDYEGRLRRPDFFAEQTSCLPLQMAALQNTSKLVRRTLPGSTMAARSISHARRLDQRASYANKLLCNKCNRVQGRAQNTQVHTNLHMSRHRHIHTSVYTHTHAHTHIHTPMAPVRLQLLHPCPPLLRLQVEGLLPPGVPAPARGLGHQ